MILISKYIVPRGYLSITIFPFIFLRSKDLTANWRLVNHERIHLKQQVELLILPFYLLYALEFIVRLMQYKKWSLAYRHISFEREAYDNESDKCYLKSRFFWSFLSYF